MLNTLITEKIAGISIIAIAGAALFIIIIIIAAAASKSKKKPGKKLTHSAATSPDKSPTRFVSPGEKGEIKNFELSKINIHNDLQGLIITWDNVNTLRGINSGGDILDPSLVDEYLPVNLSASKKDAAPLGNQTSFAKMSPAQRGRYLNFLCDPYDTQYEQGYALLLLYGLERHIVFGSAGAAADVISRLKKVHKGKAFSEPAFAALSYFFQRNNRFFDLFKEEYDDLNYDQIIYYHMNTDKLLPCDAIVSNMNKYPSFADKTIPPNKWILINALKDVMNEKYGEPAFPLKRYNASNTPKLSNQPFPANPSLDKIVTRYINSRHIYDVEPMKSEIEEMLKNIYIGIVS